MAANSASSFGELLRQSREAARLTQEALAERAGISARTITDLERGVIRAPRRDTLDMIADALSFPPEQRQEWHSLRRELSTRRSPSERTKSPDPQLPQPPNSLIGRRDDIRALVDLLTRPDVRLVTVTGPGGVGKTRVALAVAYELTDVFPEGLRFIELAAVRDPGLLLPVIAEELGIREGDEQAARERLKTYLFRRQMLLVLDNLEHLLSAGPDIADLLSSSSGLTMLVTSRARLQIQAEHEFLLSPLPVPGIERTGERDKVEDYAAIELFMRRSQQVAPGFSVSPDNVAAITAICTHLDGLTPGNRVRRCTSQSTYTESDAPQAPPPVRVPYRGTAGCAGSS